MPDYPAPPDHKAIESFNRQHDRKHFEQSVDKLVDFLIHNPLVTKRIVRHVVNTFLNDKDGDL